MSKTKISMLVAGLLLVTGQAMAESKGPVTLGELSAKQAELNALDLEAKIATKKAEIAKSSDNFPTTIGGAPLATGNVNLPTGKKGQVAAAAAVEDSFVLKAIYGEKGSERADVEANGTLLTVRNGAEWKGWKVKTVEPGNNARIVLVKGKTAREVRFTADSQASVSAPSMPTNGNAGFSPNLPGLPPAPSANTIYR